MTPDKSSNLPEEEEVLADVIERMAADFRRGAVVDLESYIKRYPELADRLRELYPALTVVSQLSSTKTDSADSKKSDRG